MAHPAEAHEPSVPSPKDGSLFMRPFAFGMTAYLLAYNLLFILTRGNFKAQDPLAEMYLFVLGAYAGAPEIKRLTIAPADPDPEGWPERLRKGGPFITSWFLLWAVAVTWRIADPTIPMPPELPRITMQVIALFLGTYALRQYRKRVGGKARGNASGDERENVLAYLRQNGPSTPKTIREALTLPRRSVTRLLAELLEEGELVRSGSSPSDPAATYGVKGVGSV